MTEWVVAKETEDGQWVVARMDGDWKVACRIAVQGDKLVIAELQLGTAGGSIPIGGIDSALMRAIPIRGAKAKAEDAGLMPGLFRNAAEPETARDYTRSRKRRDRASKLAAIALLYEQAVKDGRSDVAQAVVEATGLKYSTAVYYTHEARSHEPPLLTGGGFGRSGGEATNEARRIAEGWWVTGTGAIVLPTPQLAGTGTVTNP